MKPLENHSWWSRLRPVLLLAAACAVVLPMGCGKRGPLYLPDAARAQMKAGDQAARPAPPQPDK